MASQKKKKLYRLYRSYIIYKFNNHGRMQCASHISMGLILCINISITSSSLFTHTNIIRNLHYSYCCCSPILLSLQSLQI